MRIIFGTNNPRSPSFIFYSSSLSKINEIDDETSIDIVEDLDSVDFNHYDFLLLMGGSNFIDKVKLINPNIFCGLVEPRAKQYNDISKFDFIITNGLESEIFFSSRKIKTITYPTYPLLNNHYLKKKEVNKFIIGYHGNKVHLESMFPRITDAILDISLNTKVEFWAMYNYSKMGKSKLINSKKLGFHVKHIQYSEENYYNFIANCDIGLVPQLKFKKSYSFGAISRLIFSDQMLKKYKKLDKIYENISSVLKRYLGLNLPVSSRYDYDLVFKEVTNLGRHFVFAQFSIPVISDVAPSSCGFIKHGENSFLAYDTESWACNMQQLMNNDRRAILGQKFYNAWISEYDHSILNKKLIVFLKKNFFQKSVKKNNLN
jgi:hypothetical protein